MLATGTLQNTYKVLMVSVLHACCSVYIAFSFNSPHDGAGQYVVFSISAVVMLCVKWCGCCNCSYLTGICIRSRNNEHHAAEKSLLGSWKSLSYWSHSWTCVEPEGTFCVHMIQNMSSVLSHNIQVHIFVPCFCNITYDILSHLCLCRQLLWSSQKTVARIRTYIIFCHVLLWWWIVVPIPDPMLEYSLLSLCLWKLPLPSVIWEHAILWL
jgi:hypothetical protein